MNANSLSEHPKGPERPMYQLQFNIVKSYKIFRSLKQFMYKIFIVHLVKAVNFITIGWIVLMYQTFKHLILILTIIYFLFPKHTENYNSTCSVHCYHTYTLPILHSFGLKFFNNPIIIFNINKIIAEHRSVDLSRFYNRNAIYKFQFTA